MTAASLGAIDLPALPEPWGDMSRRAGFPVQGYTAAQMQEYARAALAALTPEAAPAGVVAWSRADTIRANDGTPIGLDEPRVEWGPECPDPDGGWHPLYAAPVAAPAAGGAVAIVGEPPAAKITADWVIGYLPASAGQSDETQDALRACREGVAHAFAEWAALSAAPAGEDATDYLGAALALEAEFHKPESQSLLRAMEAAANALRIAHAKHSAAAPTPEGRDYCPACLQWMGGPLACCDAHMAAPGITKAEADKLRATQQEGGSHG